MLLDVICPMYSTFGQINHIQPSLPYTFIFEPLHTIYLYMIFPVFFVTILIIVPINYVIPMIFPEYSPCISTGCFSGNCLLQLLRLRPLREPLRAPAVQLRRRRAQPEVLGDPPQAPRQERQAQVIAQAAGETQHRDDLISRKS